MGEVHVQIAITNPRTGNRSEIMALADTGATLSVIPATVLETLGIERVRSIIMVMTDGRRAARDLGDAVVSVNDDSTPCRVIFGHPGDEPLLGVTVLEQLGLAVDPVHRRLVPARLRL